MTLGGRLFLSSSFFTTSAAGLTTRFSAADHDVAIIGAGIAGLTAARALASAGKNVLLLEARQRIGGRVFTDSDLGFAFDQGAPTVTAPQPAAAGIGHRQEPLKPGDERYEKGM